MDKKFLNNLVNNLKEDNQKQKLNSKILLIDGLNTFLRSFSIVNHLNSNNNHVGGLTGFLQSIGYAIKLINPTRVIIVFDGPGGSNSKKNLYPQYKGNRDHNKITNYNVFNNNKEEESEAMQNQIARLMQYLRVLPLDLLCIDSVEADDIIGYLVSKYEKNIETNQITVMSADQDFLQLASSKTQIYSPTKKKIYNQDLVLKEYKVHSNNFIIMKTLLGDNSDNLPGVDKLGPKKLEKLFPELKTENELLLNEIFEKCECNLNEHFLYNSILEFKNQLKINFLLMNLKSNVLSEENKNIIENTLLQEAKLDKQHFLLMYNNDNLGELVKNVYNWITNTFNSLNIYRQKGEI